MFSVYCPDHGATLLLGTDHIEAVANHGSVIEVHWRCDQGHHGTWLIERAAAAAA